MTNICGTQRGSFTLQWDINIRRSGEQLLLFPGGRLEGMLRRALRRVLYSHSWMKEMTLRAGRDAIPPGNSLITQGSPSCFRDGMLSVSLSSGYKYPKSCYIMSFIHRHYGKVWLENCTFETNIMQFRDSWNKHWMKQISQVPSPREIPNDSSTIHLFQIWSAVSTWNMYY